VPSNVTALIPVNAIGDPATLAVDYSLVSNPVDGFSFGITVGDGDVDYNTKTYYFRVNKLAAQIPCLTDLTVMVSSIDYLNPSFDRARFAYDAVIPATVTETEALVRWDYDSSVVQSVFTAVDGGAWSLGTDAITLTGLTPGASKLLRIKARTFEGNEAEYTITVSHAVSTAAQLVNIEIIWPNYCPLSFNRGVYYYAQTIITSTTNVTLQITPPVDGTWQASIDGVSTSSESSSVGTQIVSGISVGTPKIVTITGKAQDGVSTAIYTLVLTQAGDVARHLDSIAVSGTAGKTEFDSGLFQGGTFNYTITLEYSASGTVILTPALLYTGGIDNANEHVFTIINSVEQLPNTTSANLTPAENSQHIVVFQVRSKDTMQASAVYTVIVRRKGDPDNKLVDLQATGLPGGSGINPPIQPPATSANLASVYNYTYEMPISANRVIIEAKGPASSEVWYSTGTDSAYTQLIGYDFLVDDIPLGSNVVVNIQVRPQEASAGWSVYTLVLQRPTSSFLYTYTSPTDYVWIAPYSGVYQFELWGAEGGLGGDTSVNNSGKGGYIKAKKTISANGKLYLFVGQQGNDASISGVNGVYGGGGGGGASPIYAGGGGGGGATAVRSSSGGLLLIAGGGGGGVSSVVDRDKTYQGGRGSGTDVGGNAQGYSGVEMYGATNSSVTSNGIGQTGRPANGDPGCRNGAGGGGGGYRGGLAQQASGSNTDASGGGGNGYIDTASGWTLLDTDRVGNTGTGDFKDIPKPIGEGTEAGHSGAGFIRITYMGQ
jgi:hypothetical protein